MGKPEGKRLIGRHLRWESNIKVDLQEVGCRAMDWIELDKIVESLLALVNALMNFRCSIKCVDFLD